MNKERMLAVADAIEKEEIAKFRMLDFIEKCDNNQCGTTACVAGFAHLIMGTKINNDIDNVLSNDRLDEARNYLGLNYEEARELFYAGSMDNYNNAEYDELEDGYIVIDDLGYNKYGAQVIRWMVENDRINWNEALTAVGAIK